MIITGPDLQKSLAWKALIAGGDQVNCYVLNPGSAALPLLQGYTQDNKSTRAFVCQGLRCLPPVESVEALQLQIENL